MKLYWRFLAQVCGGRGSVGVAGTGLLILVLACLWDQIREKEIALIIGEPWEDMRQRSSARISPAIPNEIWHGIPEPDARLRFADSQYGFLTPPARFFTIGYVRDVVTTVRMSPQVEPLLLEDTLKVVLDLQEQWRSSGWQSILTQTGPPFADTSQSRSRLRNARNGSVTYWQAGEKYQVMLVVRHFVDDKRPTDERYLITLALSKPWIKY
ncbi:hypothetical protein [Pseudomonas maioricensis]|uniref:hypothetical protein n=1 Tax=Pseudomonas maioricensis TaxID=1766623 RepID=UPI001FAE3955|nr:hypothetical protein [Pseudomonas sp. S25]